jgi:hypothetical protein
MVMLRPSYEVNLGSATVERGGTGDLVSVRASTDMDGRAGLCRVVLSADNPDLEFAVGDTFDVSLGYVDDTTKVFTGTIDSVVKEFGYIRVLALNSIAKLQRFRTDKYFENQTCGAIVSGLAGSANVSAGAVEDGVQLPFYAVDSAKNAHEHIVGLAGRCGHEAYADAGDSLVFGPYEAAAPKQFEYGKTVVSAARVDRDAIFGSVHVYGESPSSSKGADAVHWLTKTPVDATSGDGAALTVDDGAVRDAETAGSVGSSLLTLVARNAFLQLSVVGDATVFLNDTVQLSGMTDESMNGDYQVRGVEHIFAKTKGFITTLTLSGGSEE